MAVSLYDAAIPSYLNMPKNLAALLEKAEAHAKAAGKDPQAYLEARLTDDMLPLTRQIQMASDAAKLGAARLAGVTPPPFPDTETTWAEVKARIQKTVDYLGTIRREDVEGDDSRIIELPLPDRKLTFTARDFLFNFSLPNFLFHVVTAYGLLRKEDVPLGKMDYLAGAQLATAAA